MPLSALEAHRAWVTEDYEDVKIVPEPPPAVAEQFEVGKRLALFERFMISLRNDELETMGPGEPEHGKISYHYDKYLFWQDEQTQGLPWFSQHTERPGDIYWTVNRAVIHLQQDGVPGTLNVLLEAEAPNLKAFEVQFDDGEWEVRPGVFDWPLKPGENRLAVRPVNALGRKGTESHIIVARL